MSSSPVGDLFIHLLFLPCGVNMLKIQILSVQLGQFQWEFQQLQFLVSQEGLLLCTFITCSLCADKIRNFWSGFLYDFCPLFRCLFATCSDRFAVLRLSCDFINTNVVIKCWEFAAFPWQGEWCWFYPLPQNFSVFITLFSLPQRTFLSCSSCRRETASCIYRSVSKESPRQIAVWSDKVAQLPSSPLGALRDPVKSRLLQDCSSSKPHSWGI